MRTSGNQSFFPAAVLVLLLFAGPVLSDNKKPPVPAKPSAPAKKTGSGSGPKKLEPVKKPQAQKDRKTTPATNISVTKRDEKVATVYDAKRNTDVHHGLNGNRRVVVERPDHTRVVAERGGRSYVQRPYIYHGHEYARRSYYYHGRYYHAYYGRYEYRGVYINPYYPAYYYAPAYYGWLSYPWAAPATYAWSWATSPWYAYYGAWFRPHPVYANASLWFTDYLIATSLAEAYQVHADALSSSSPFSPDVKQLIAEEVKRQVTVEYNEALAAGKNADPDPALSSIQRDLNDGIRHVFVAGRDLDVASTEGAECALSEGDALQMTGSPQGTAASLTVLATKGDKECPVGTLVSVSLQDLQEMRNYMRETIDHGMQELQNNQGHDGLPAAPAAAKVPPIEAPMAALAPPPPPEQDVASEINQQSQAADQAEKEAVGKTAPPT